MSDVLIKKYILFQNIFHIQYITFYKHGISVGQIGTLVYLLLVWLSLKYI